MRNYILLAALCFSLSTVGQELQLAWKKDFNVANELAKSQNKQILVYFTKSDCSDCVEFYTNFFKKDDFKNVSNKFVLLMLDGSNNDINSTDLTVIKLRRMVMHYNKALIFPAVLVLDSDRKPLGEFFSSTDENSIAEYMNFLETLK